MLSVARRCLDAVCERGERTPSWRFVQLCDDFGPVFAGTRMHACARALAGFADAGQALIRAGALLDDFGPTGRSFPAWVRGAFEGASDAWRALAALEDDPRVSTGFEQLLRRELTLLDHDGRLQLALRADEELHYDG